MSDGTWFNTLMQWLSGLAFGLAIAAAMTGNVAGLIVMAVASLVALFLGVVDVTFGPS